MSSESDPNDFVVLHEGRFVPGTSGASATPSIRCDIWSDGGVPSGSCHPNNAIHANNANKLYNPYTPFTPYSAFHAYNVDAKRPDSVITTSSDTASQVCAFWRLCRIDRLMLIVLLFRLETLPAQRSASPLRCTPFPVCTGRFRCRCRFR